MILKGSNLDCSQGVIFTLPLTDKATYLEIAEEAAISLQVRIHAYVFMDNHVHWLISSSIPETTVTWAVLRSEGFLAGSGVTAPVNSFGGNITLQTAGGSLVLCHAGVSDEQMDLVDTRYDDGVAATGAINYALATGGTALTTSTASTGVVVCAGALCIAY